MLCERRLQDFVSKRGLGVWDYRLLESDPGARQPAVRGPEGRQRTLRLCGITKEERPLQVNHIKPRSRGGTNAFENLQALSGRMQPCEKRQGYGPDFPGGVEDRAVADCDFCLPSITGRVIGPRLRRWRSTFPVTQGHLLVLPRRHTTDMFSMVERERIDANNLLRILRCRIQRDDPTVTGFNIGTNCGEAAGQSVMHAHIHLIPRRRGDVAEPRGGVRGVIPGRMAY